MPHLKFLCRHHRPFALLATVLFATCTFAATPSEKVIYSFQGGNDGANPSSNLIADSAGNLYGTTTYGGSGQCVDSDEFVIGCGTVFELVKPAQSGGKWSEKVLYSFQGSINGLTDSGYPTAGLTLGAGGNLYGTTSGGTNPNSLIYDNGTVFELSPPTTSGGAWIKTMLYAFQGANDGGSPRDGVIFDSKGQLYGSTSSGAPINAGTLFRLTPPTQSGGAWTETILYAFMGGSDGQNPAGVIFDGKGSLYGITAAGGGFSFGGDQYSDYWSGGGTLFKLTPSTVKGKPWTEALPFVFTPCVFNDFDSSGSCGPGTQPEGSPVFDAAGNIYGTAELGGNASYCQGKGEYWLGCGAVYELVAPTIAGGAWTQNVLYAFEGTDGAYPLSSVAFDSAGNLYGTTSDQCMQYVGCPTQLGMVFELSPPTAQGGSWTETVLHQFAGGSDGATPVAAVLVRGSALYSTTQYGGTGNCIHLEGTPAGCGTIFEISQ